MVHVEATNFKWIALVLFAIQVIDNLWTDAQSRNYIWTGVNGNKYGMSTTPTSFTRCVQSKNWVLGTRQLRHQLSNIVTSIQWRIFNRDNALLKIKHWLQSFSEAEDPGFPRPASPKVGAKTYYFGHSSSKLHEIEKKSYFDQFFKKTA